MDDYIKREALRDALYDADAITMNGVKILNQFPSADVAPVKHGRRNHSDKHLWFKDSDGEIDIFMYRDGCHHGPVCRVCGVSFCVNCTPDFDETTCYLGHYECSECGYQMEEDTSRFCPNCGAKMDGYDNA